MFSIKNVIVLLTVCVAVFSPVKSQEAYNDCNQALMLCPGQQFTVNNIGAGKTLFPNGEDDFTFCYTPNNTIWLTFETNPSGGNVTVNFTNVLINAVAGRGTELQAVVVDALAPCDGTTYVEVSNCINNAAGNFSLLATGLAPSKKYYIIINGAINGTATLPAEGTMNVEVTGPGADRPIPYIGAFTDTLNVCRNTAVSLQSYRSNCPDSTSFKWYRNGVLIAVTDENFFTTSEIENGDILTVKTSCYTYCTEEIESSLGPFSVNTYTIDAGPDLTIVQGQTVRLMAASTADSVLWAPSADLNDPKLVQPLANPKTTTHYFITGYSGGCSYSDGMTVFVKEDLEITNTFTPNGDGKNDTWQIPPLENYPNCLVQIFSRWGQLMYQTSGYSEKKAWDGKTGGRDVEAGVYFYVIDLRDSSSTEPIKGVLNLVR